MTDDRRPKQRRPISIMGDDERATIGRGRRPQEWPVSVEPELTPPPTEPPPPSTLPGYDRLEPEIRDQLNMLAAGLGDLTGAVGKLWDSRKDSDRLSKLDERFDTLQSNDADHRAAIEDFLKPSVKGIMGQLSLLVSYYEQNKARQEVFWEHQWPAAMKQIEVIGKQLDRIERDIDRLETEGKVQAAAFTNDIAVLRTRVTATELSAQTVDIRVKALERRNDEQDAGDKRELALTTKQRVARGALISGLVAAGGVVSQVVSWILNR